MLLITTNFRLTLPACCRFRQFSYPLKSPSRSAPNPAQFTIPAIACLPFRLRQVSHPHPHTMFNASHALPLAQGLGRIELNHVHVRVRTSRHFPSHFYPLLHPPTPIPYSHPLAPIPHASVHPRTCQPFLPLPPQIFLAWALLPLPTPFLTPQPSWCSTAWYDLYLCTVYWCSMAR